MEKRDMLELGEESFRRINSAVIQDIEDYLIRKGMGKKPQDYDNGNHFIFAYLRLIVMKKMTKEDKEELPEDYFPDIRYNFHFIFNHYRPPLMWNHPIPLTQRHSYRYHFPNFLIKNFIEIFQDQKISIKTEESTNS